MPLISLIPFFSPQRFLSSVPHSVQSNSVAQSCPTLWDPMNGSMPGLSVHHQLPEFTQTHVHQVGDAIQPSHPQSSPSPPAFSLHQHQGLSKDSVICIRWPKHCSFSFSIILPTNIQDWFPLRLIGWISFQSKGLSRVFSNTTVQKHQFFALSFLYSPRLTSIDNHWKNHSFD